MKNTNTKLVTVIYYDVNTLELSHFVGEFPVKNKGRVILPQSFKDKKEIVSVCDGENTPLEIEYTEKSNRNQKMKRQDNKVVTVFYYDNRSLVLKHRVMHYPYTANGKVMIPTAFKKFRAILAVFEGDLTVLNKVGERILPMEDAA